MRCLDFRHAPLLGLHGKCKGLQRENTNQGGVILCPLPQSPPEILRAADGGVDVLAETPRG
jgi:hypothetical protein